ncbi:endonuclease/exonuclease/phosphatase family protein [Puniceibacterium sediminis]|uniref:Metal-dependent hydrolase, endonuclease/exonuclease/phosphatase family n=1 Tax=Puniceibacterium sediminis TaxID=1608407 RepID=A0A238W0X4_9RHOB|nr:endonuclease/exonuclease/phosphatase family protein [Puniceibacterium sediminis]SNR40138.1 Metal-dependent hydrolase, endonuclease/exonuclease/phosphatase family [Puniceibacterium sediminis]
MTEETADFRIASYNIRKALGTDRRRDPDRVMAVIAALKADIVIVQEADLRLGARKAALPGELIEAHTGLVPVPLARSHVSLGWHGIAVLTRPSISITDILTMDLPGLEPRGAVIVDLALSAGPLRVVGTHLGLLRRSRRAQVLHIRERLAELPPCPTILAGDLNEFSTSVGLGRLVPTFQIHTPGRTFHARRPFAALDRFATNDLVQLIDTGVMHDAMTALASDHLPIWAQGMLLPRTDD